jgi:hypothetical protein
MKCDSIKDKQKKAFFYKKKKSSLIKWLKRLVE